MQFTAKQIGELVNGYVEGDAGVTVRHLSKIEEAKAGSLAFLSNPKYEPFLYTTDASVVIVNEELQLDQPVAPTLVRVKNAYTAFSTLLAMYNSIRFHKEGREEPVFIASSATIGKGCYIGAFAYIGENVTIGDNVKIFPNSYIGDNSAVGDDSVIYAGVCIYFDSVIGSRVIIHSGAVIGSDGFGFAPQENGAYLKINQIGNVVIEDDVEIGANTTVDRATMGSTFIRRGVKLDNLIQLAHNVDIGADTVIAAQTGVSGSTKIGERVLLGGQVGVAGHITVAKGSQVQAQSGINRSIEEEEKKWAGTPATAYNVQMRAQVILHRLPELERRLEELERKLQQITE